MGQSVYFADLLNRKFPPEKIELPIISTDPPKTVATNEEHAVFFDPSLSPLRASMESLPPFGRNENHIIKSNALGDINSTIGDQNHVLIRPPI